jgi:hypothetical protein
MRMLTKLTRTIANTAYIHAKFLHSREECTYKQRYAHTDFEN